MKQGWLNAGWALGLAVLLVAVSACSSDDSQGMDAGVVMADFWNDPVSGLAWQNPHSGVAMPWDDAVGYCERLSIEGYDDWRLPKVQELISLLAECDQSQCELVDPDCLQNRCVESCPNCSEEDVKDGGTGATPGDCYWNEALEGECTSLWSSSSSASDSAAAWRVSFYFGNMFAMDKTTRYAVRCVRTGAVTGDAGN